MKLSKIMIFIRRFTYLSFFLVFFGMGIVVGRIIFQGQEDYRENITAQEPTPSVADGKTRGLIVGVSELSPDFDYTPLKSAWWVIIDHEKHTLLWMPLYPVIGNQSLAAYQVPHQPIPINTSSLASYKDLEVFARQGVTWDFTILIDEAALSEIISLTGNTSQPANVPLDMYAVWENPDQALQFQEGLIRHLCSYPETFADPDNLFLALNNLGTHLHTDLSRTEIIDLVRTLELGDRDAELCRFLYHQSTAAE